MDSAVVKIVAVPVLDKQNGMPVAVISLYNPSEVDFDTYTDIS